MNRFAEKLGWKLMGWPWDLTFYPFTNKSPLIYRLGARLSSWGNRR